MEEREPKTLSLHELNDAREAALYVLSTHSSQDAARIFTKVLTTFISLPLELVYQEKKGQEKCTRKPFITQLTKNGDDELAFLRLRMAGSCVSVFNFLMIYALTRRAAGSEAGARRREQLHGQLRR